MIFNISTLSKGELLAFKQLSTNNNIVITKPDKGNGVVIMNRSDYLDILDIVSDPTKFKLLTEDPTEQRETRLQNFLYRLYKRGELDESTYKCIRPTGSNPSQMYGLPKIHKDGVPLGPIISQIGSYTYDLAKFLVPILSPLMKNEYSVKDSFSFVNELSSVQNAPYVQF